MPPRRISFAAMLASQTTDSNILIERDANDNLMFGNSADFIARPLHIRDVLQYFCAKDAVKRIGGEDEFGCVTFDRHDTVDFESGFLKIEGRDFGKVLSQEPGVMAVS